MKRRLGLVVAILGFCGAVASGMASTALADSHHAALLRIEGPIQPVAAGFLHRGIDKADEDQSELLIVTLDTPGGLFESTRRMVESIMASGVPVVVFVSPSGARAASAGTFITAAAHVAAMSTISNIGAASPVSGSGEDLSATLKAKANEDATALMRSIAEARGRNAEALEATILEATAYSSSEALEEGIIDLIATDIDDLLAQLDGMEVALSGGTVVLETDGIEVRPIEKTVLENFLAFLGNPTVAFMLLALGAIGIFIEFYLGAGLILPGVAGAISLALAFVAMGQLPVNWVGLALIGGAMFLLYLELQAPGTGIFGVSGVISFALGALLLFGGFAVPGDLPGLRPPPIETPSFRVNPWLIAGVTLGLSGLVLGLARSIMTARTAGTSDPTAVVALVGQTGVVATVLAPSGMVHVAGEQWSAVSDSGDTIEQGEEVMVVEAEGLTLKVFRTPEAVQEMEDEAAEEGQADI